MRLLLAAALMAASPAFADKAADDYAVCVIGNSPIMRRNMHRLDSPADVYDAARAACPVPTGAADLDTVESFIEEVVEDLAGALILLADADSAGQ